MVNDRKEGFNSPPNSNRRKHIALLILLFFVGGLNAEHEIIKVTAEQKWPTEYLLYRFSDGSAFLDNENLYIGGKGEITVQSRAASSKTDKIKLPVEHHEHLSYSKILIEKGVLTTFFHAPNGFNYICSYNLGTGQVAGPVRKHRFGGRILRTANGKLAVAGLYRPLYEIYLDRYDDESLGYQTDLSKKMFKELYQASEAFSVTIYDDNLTRVDSAAILKRNCEDAEAFELLQLMAPMDISDNDIYILEHSEGYVVSVYDSSLVKANSLKIDNDQFLRVPLNLTQKAAQSMRRKERTHSKVYALFVQNQFILCSFFQNREVGKGVIPPFYLDIIDKKGKQILSTQFQYPVVMEDDLDKVFFLVVREGGWFEPDVVYLVGMTVEDILSGEAEKPAIDEAIDRFEGKNK